MQAVSQWRKIVVMLVLTCPLLHLLQPIHQY